MTKRQTIINMLRATEVPGLTASQMAQRMRYTVCAVMGQLKAIRRSWAVEATTHIHDQRIKYYRITHRLAVPEPTLSEAAAEAKDAHRAAPAKATLSATEVEAAICSTLRSHASITKPMSMDDLVAHTGQPRAMVRPAIIALVQRETVTRVAGGYHLPPVANPMGEVAGARVVDVMHAPPYEGAELRPYNGRPGAMDAYKLPSRGMRA